MTTDAPARKKFRTGGEAAAVADAEARKSGGQFARVNFFTLDSQAGKNKAVVRVLTENDDWIYVQQHQGVPTKAKPATGYDGKWPTSLPAVCRYTDVENPAFEGNEGDGVDAKGNPEWVPMFSDCYVCDAKLLNSWGNANKATLRVWALACLREEVLWTAEDLTAGECTEVQVGRVRGYKDAVREVTIPAKDGQPETTRTERAIVVMNAAMGNFFQSLQSAYDTIKGQTGVGTVCDRDYVVTRKGDGKDTEYFFFPLDPTPNLKPGTERWKKYEEAIEEQHLDLAAMVEERSSDEFFAKFFDPTKVGVFAKKGESSGGAPAAQQEAAPANDVAPDALAAMRERVRGTKTSAEEVD